MAELTLERFNELRYVKYPFIEDSLIDPLATDVLLDLHGIIYSRDIGRLRLESLAVSVDEATVVATFSYVAVSGAGLMIPVTIPSSAEAWLTLDYYQGQVLNLDVALYPTFGSGIVAFASGRSGTTVSFTDHLLWIEPACLCIRNRHVVNSMTSSTLVTLAGDVKIMPGYNMTVSVVHRANTIKLGAQVGSGEGMPCEELLAIPRNCEDLIYKINGQTPDWYGDWLLDAGPGITVTADKANSKIIIKTPFRACPGCRE